MSDAPWFDPILRHPVTRGVATGLAGATLLLSASSARAQDAQPYGAGGVFVGYTWSDTGEGGDGVLWGIEGRGGMVLREPWNDDPGFAANAVARFGFVDLDPQLHLGGQVGVSYEIMAVMADVALGYRWGDHGGWSLPAGLELQVHFASTFLRIDPLLEQGAAGVGASLPPRESTTLEPVIGLPIMPRPKGGAVLPSVQTLGPPKPPTDIDTGVANELSDAWRARARSEWAAVSAFHALAEQLEIAGAPVSLTHRAHHAARDEVRHAISAARVSTVYGGAPIRLGAISSQLRPPLQGLAALRRLAAEAWTGGCLAEGKAATVLAHEAALAPTEAQRALSLRIATDEQRHADLAWDVLRWCVATGGDDVRQVLHACRDAAPPRTSSFDVGPELRAHGLLSEPEHARVFAETHAVAQRRLALLLD